MMLLWTFVIPRWRGGKESACQFCGLHPWVGKIPWRRKWQSTPVFLLRKLYGRRVGHDWEHNLLSIFLCTSCCLYLLVKLLGHMVTVFFLTIWRTAKLFSKVAVLFYIPTTSIRVLISLHPGQLLSIWL